MTLENRIDAFAALGTALGSLTEGEWDQITMHAQQGNAWFTPESVRQAVAGVCTLLRKEDLQAWTARYPIGQGPALRVGVVMAGNIPLVGFHDYLAVLMAGHTLYAKLSSQDAFLLPYVNGILKDIAPDLAAKAHFPDTPIKEVDAMIATGSNNTARYFEYYFKKYPHIIRQNRTSVAVLQGDESVAQLQALGQDVFQYYGLGCRNVSKVYIPEDYELKTLFEAWQEPYEGVANHHKYVNNYDYHKSIMLVNRDQHLDTGYLLLQEREELVSPSSVLYYERYTDAAALAAQLQAQEEQIQCTVSTTGGFVRDVAPGEAQQPRVWDYADGVDTMEFLTKLS